MDSNQIFKIDNAKNEFKLIPIKNSIRIIPEKGTPFTITNNGSNNISTIVKKFYANYPRFNVSIENWFGENKIPNSVNKLDNVLDYFIDIRFVKTEISIQEKIFLSEKELSEFLVKQDVYSVTYTGAAIPDFLDYSGIISHRKDYLDYSIVNMININDKNVVNIVYPVLTNELYLKLKDKGLITKNEPCALVQYPYDTSDYTKSNENNFMNFINSTH